MCDSQSITVHRVTPEDAVVASGVLSLSRSANHRLPTNARVRKRDGGGVMTVAAAKQNAPVALDTRHVLLLFLSTTTVIFFFNMYPFNISDFSCARPFVPWA